MIDAAIEKTGRFAQPLKFLISGGTSAVANFTILYILTDVFGMYYLISSVFAFIVGLITGFLLQRFWTFKGTTAHSVHRQAQAYGALAGANVIINTFFMYSFVEFLGLHYLVAQFLSSIIIATESFFIYKRFIFR